MGIRHDGFGVGRGVTGKTSASVLLGPVLPPLDHLAWNSLWSLSGSLSIILV